MSIPPDHLPPRRRIHHTSRVRPRPTEQHRRQLHTREHAVGLTINDTTINNSTAITGNSSTINPMPSRSDTANTPRKNPADSNAKQQHRRRRQTESAKRYHTFSTRIISHTRAPQPRTNIVRHPRPRERIKPIRDLAQPVIALVPAAACAEQCIRIRTVITRRHAETSSFSSTNSARSAINARRYCPATVPSGRSVTTPTCSRVKPPPCLSNTTSRCSSDNTPIARHNAA